MFRPRADDTPLAYGMHMAEREEASWWRPGRGELPRIALGFLVSAWVLAFPAAGRSAVVAGLAALVFGAAMLRAWVETRSHASPPSLPWNRPVLRWHSVELATPGHSEQRLGGHPVGDWGTQNAHGT